MSYTWFEVDKEGLAQQIVMRGKSFVVKELVQNGWDAGAARVDVTLEPIAGRRGRARLVVEDDSRDGFADMRHAYTIFASSPKKGDPTLRGRFDLGEKLVLALCDSARIVSVEDAVEFAADGSRRKIRARTTAGTRFEATVRMTKAEIDEAAAEMFLLLPPTHIRTTFNGEAVPARVPLAAFEATLPTVVADDEGVLRSTSRKTHLAIHQPLDGETPTLFEMGVPIVESQTPFHVDVQQRIPLNHDRDNVTPAYARQIATAVVNAAHDLVSAEDLRESWTSLAMDDKAIAPEAVRAIIAARFGEKVVSFDPSDREASSEAAAQGYVVLHGGSLSANAWQRVRETGAVSPAGRLFPTPRPFSDDPEAEPAKVVPPDEWTPDMAAFADVAARLGTAVLERTVRVVILERMNSDHAAAWDPQNAVLFLSLGTLGKRWFTAWRSDPERGLGLLIHEYAHHYGDDHLSAEYRRGLERVAARVAALALREPALLRG